MPFEPEHLRAHQLPPNTEGAPVDREVYSRKALSESAPEEDNEAYMDAADRWVEGHDGFIFGAERNLYILYPGHVWPEPGRSDPGRGDR